MNQLIVVCGGCAVLCCIHVQVLTQLFGHIAKSLEVAVDVSTQQFKVRGGRGGDEEKCPGRNVLAWPGMLSVAHVVLMFGVCMLI
jgi:hypothetical protein